MRNSEKYKRSLTKFCKLCFLSCYSRRKDGVKILRTRNLFLEWCPDNLLKLENAAKRAFSCKDRRRYSRERGSERSRKPHHSKVPDRNTRHELRVRGIGLFRPLLPSLHSFPGSRESNGPNGSVQRTKRRQTGLESPPTPIVDFLLPRGRMFISFRHFGFFNEEY